MSPFSSGMTSDWSLSAAQLRHGRQVHARVDVDEVLVIGDQVTTWLACAGVYFTRPVPSNPMR